MYLCIVKITNKVLTIKNIKIMITFLLGFFGIILLFAFACAVIPVLFSIIGMVLQFIWAIFTGDIK